MSIAVDYPDHANKRRGSKHNISRDEYLRDAACYAADKRPYRKLTPEQVRQMREDYAKRKELRGKLYHNSIPTMREWAQRLGVSIATVEKAVHGLTYKRV